MKLTDLLKEIIVGKVYTAKDKPPFKVNEAKMAIGKGKYANLYNIKEDMKEGKFDPKDPQVHVHGFGVYSLKMLEKVISKELKECARRAQGSIEWVALTIYRKHSTLESKIKAANDVYQQMNTPQYKRAATMYKKKR